MLYPAMLNITGKKAVVVGGGPVAARKVRSLAAAGAQIEVISPEVSEAMSQLLGCNGVRWLRKEFSPSDLVGAFIIIAATNSRETNQLVNKSTSPHQLVNLADDPEESSFIVPASFQKDKLSIAVSTHGASPALSKRIVQELREQFDDEYISYLSFLDKCRAAIKQSFSDPSIRQLVFKELASPAFEKRAKVASCSEREQLLEEVLTDWRENNE